MKVDKNNLFSIKDFKAPTAVIVSYSKKERILSILYRAAPLPIGLIPVYNKCMELITGENDSGRRLDRILRKALPDYPLPLIHRLLRQKLVLLNGKPGKAQDHVENGVTITISSIGVSKNENINKNEDKNTAAQTGKKEKNNRNILFTDSILWQDSDLLAVNKPKGIAVHGQDSLETQVRSYLKEKILESLSFKCGPLHRLDKPTSGIVVFSKSLEGARLFSSLIQERKIKKTYLAIVEGIIEKEEIWQDELFHDKRRKKTYIGGSHNGKNAVTNIYPLSSINGLSLIRAEIITGRTHQIRSQAASRKHPLAGDIKYRGRKFNKPAANGNEQTAINGKNKADFYLHAWKLEFFKHTIIAPLPEDFLLMIKNIFGEAVIKLLPCGQR